MQSPSPSSRRTTRTSRLVLIVKVVVFLPLVAIPLWYFWFLRVQRTTTTKPTATKTAPLPSNATRTEPSSSDNGYTYKYLHTRTIQHPELLKEDPLVIQYYEHKVPENRNNPHSRKITIGYSLVKQQQQQQQTFADDDGDNDNKNQTTTTPVFLIAGGPGSSINAQLDSHNEYKRLRVIQKLSVLRQVGDVYIVDLRGTYLSTPKLHCPGQRQQQHQQQHQQWRKRFGVVKEQDDYYRLMTRAAAACREYLMQQQHEGFDLDGYNALQAAQDHVDIAQAHGLDKIHLVGTSFGSFLSLTIARYHPERISRVFATGIEGFDLSVDDMDLVGEAVEKIAEQARGVWGNRHGFRDPLQAYRSLIEQARKDEAKCNGKTLTLAKHLCRKFSQKIRPFEYKLFTKGGGNCHLKRRDEMMDWPRQLDRYMSGEQQVFLESRHRAQWMGVGSSAATEGLFDCSSGVSTARGDYLRQHNMDHPFLMSDYRGFVANCAGWQVTRLPESFRLPEEPIRAHVLLVHGTIDTSTPIQNARDTIAQFPNGFLVEVENASHDVFLEVLKYYPDSFADTIVSFLRLGKLPTTNRTTLPPIEFHNFTDRN